MPLERPGDGNRPLSSASQSPQAQQGELTATAAGGGSVNPSTFPPRVRPAPCVGIASRLVNKDPTPYSIRFATANVPLARPMLSSDGYSGARHCYDNQVDPRVGYAPPPLNYQYPYFPSPLPFVYGNNQGNPVLMYHHHPSTGTQSTTVSMPFASSVASSSSNPHLSQSTSQLFFHYPLHHLTGGGPLAGLTLPQNQSTLTQAPMRLNTSGIPHPLPAPRPMADSSLDPSPITTLDPSPIATLASPTSQHSQTVVPAFIFDDSECDVPEDLSHRNYEPPSAPATSGLLLNQRSSDPSLPIHAATASHKDPPHRNNEPPLPAPPTAGQLPSQCNYVNCDPALPVLAVKTAYTAEDFTENNRISEMDVAAAVWSERRDMLDGFASSSGEDYNCSTVVDAVKRKRIARDCSYIRNRAILSQLPQSSREYIAFPRYETPPTPVLDAVGLTVPSAEDVVEGDGSSVIEGVDVDHLALRAFASRLSAGASAASEEEKEPLTEVRMKCLLEAVGLVEKDTASHVPATRESLLARRSKKRPRVSGLTALDVAGGGRDSEVEDGARCELRKRLQESSSDLTQQLKRLQAKLAAVKRLTKEEKECEDGRVAGLLAELDAVLAD
ncbi:hypothetical protein BV898_14861 [Hypsibius exemplaris]|uniref:Uncharacterized protein n=1 Tax=Hypsibius exemplaris TaxID=2072580 RepID=A0A9X6N9F3_HYPEX|nr:hypothetical protein BV898_14861 [Hypsibius exemplaris]